MNNSALVVVAKQPIPGETKTRLCPPLTAEAAADLYRCLLLDTLVLIQRLKSVDVTLAYTPATARAYFGEITHNGCRLMLQEGVDLGQRLSKALADHFRLGYQHVAVMNSDGPTLPLAFLENAFSGLEYADVTLGISHDGGYYLIGMRRLYPDLFRGIAWSTEQVATQTLDACRRLGLTVHQLPRWYDVDVEADLEILRRDLARDPAAAPNTRALLRSWEGL